MGKIFYIKNAFLGVFVFLTVLNVVKYEMYMLLNPTCVQKNISEDACISHIHYRPHVHKANGSDPLKEIGKILDLITLFPESFYNCEPLNISNGLTIDTPSLFPDIDSGQYNLHLRI